MTSLNPSPLTSPAVAADSPRCAPARSETNVQLAVGSRPSREPFHTATIPSLIVPAAQSGAPAMTSLKPSPLISPAVPTVVASFAEVWLLSAVQSGLEEGHEALPW